MNKYKIKFARALLNSPNLLLLDEPTNHVDIKSILWIRAFLKNWNGAYLLVSHDLRLLDEVTEYTWILRNGVMYKFDLPASNALRELNELDKSLDKRFHDEFTKIERLENSSKQLAIWGRDFHSKGLSRKAKSMQKMINKKKSTLERPNTEIPWNIFLSGMRLCCNQIIQSNGFSLHTDKRFLLNVAPFILEATEKIAILGANGVGKSSFLNEIWNNYRSIKAGALIQCHPKMVLGYYDQQLNSLDTDKSLLSSIHKFLDEHNHDRRTLDSDINKLLIKSGFLHADLDKKVAVLSGGEKARLMFCCLQLSQTHFLLLDEPTNHLDIYGSTELITALNAYKGGFFLASHDRNLVSSTCNKAWVFDSNQIIEFLDIDKAYDHLEVGINQGACEENVQNTYNPVFKDADELLKELINLETLLQEDLLRKSKHQRPKMHPLWEKRIMEIKTMLQFE